MEKNGTPASPTADGEERHARLPGDSTGKQRLAGAGRANQENAFGYPRAQATVLPGILEEFDDFLKLFLGLVHAGDVIEGRLGVFFYVDFGFALANSHHSAEALLLGELAENEQPEAEKEHNGNDPGEQIPQESAFYRAGELDPRLLEPLGYAGLNTGGDEARLPLRQGAFEGSADVLAADNDLFYQALVEILLEFTVGNRLDLAALNPEVPDQHNPNHRKDEVPDVKLGPFLHEFQSLLGFSGGSTDEHIVS